MLACTPPARLTAACCSSHGNEFTILLEKLWRAASGLHAVAAPGQPQAQQRSMQPKLAQLDSVQQLAHLNDELADALEADRHMARSFLYQQLPAIAEQEQSEASKLALRPALLQHLKVSAATCGLARTAHASTSALYHATRLQNLPLHGAACKAASIPVLS